LPTQSFLSITERSRSTERRTFRWTIPDATWSRDCTFRQATRKQVAVDGTAASNFLNVAFLCGTCGWWMVEQRGVAKVDPGVGYFSYRQVKGALRQYAPGDAAIPIDLLRAEVSKRPALAFETNARVWEQPVGDVLADHFRCHVRHVGPSADGGQR
jgi:hypothetical protein